MSASVSSFNTSQQFNFTEAPLDYTELSGPRVSIPLIKVAAKNPLNYLGMVLTNPGGPGSSGINQIAQSGETFQSIVGANYDIISFDPRGVGFASPMLDCSIPTSTSKRRRSIQIQGPHLNSSIYEDYFVEYTELGNICNSEAGGIGDIGPHMTTADNVRDMITIVDAFAQTTDGRRVEDASLLNFWGFSYGSYLGETFASMFPERVGRFVLDGVIDPEDYTSGLTLKNILHMDDVFALFFVYCNMAGPDGCPYYTGRTALDIYERFEASFWKLTPEHAISQGWKNATLMQSTLTTVKTDIWQFNYSPIKSFPYTSTLGLGLEQIVGSFTAESVAEVVAKIAAQQAETTTVTIENFSQPALSSAIWCSDVGGITYNSTLEELEPWLQTLQNQSVIAGELWSFIGIGCATWPILGERRYLGKFGGETQNPILFVSNTFDPVTPIEDSRKMINYFKDAQLLTIDGIGVGVVQIFPYFVFVSIFLTYASFIHTSQATNNSCASTKIGAYFQSGALPGESNFCELEAGPFGVVIPGGLERIQSGNELQSIKERMNRLRR
ncbi:hypothetical protein BP6252_13279 [Coleophoma cylindrospora]|uniref:AB hydrolase-1 domain-containing protein n=1 Tax=Coleophoma cylindrospora TaxID=1849047 RepID=A0A3D8QAD2_9HELO|nr:hypothetical protein BP6252_13279 [Coleophoma cylindrospora]